MKKLMMKMILPIAICGLALSSAHATPLTEENGLTDLTAQQVKSIHALGHIPNDGVTSPAYDFHLKRILCPNQLTEYFLLKQGDKTLEHVNYDFKENRP